MKVFLDANLSPYLAHALNALLEPEGDHVVHLTDRFARDTDDRDWITALAAEGEWVVISGDMRIFRNRLEREAWRRSRLVVFFLAPQWRRPGTSRRLGDCSAGGCSSANKWRWWRRRPRSNCRSPTEMVG
ncbi:MAG: hypothetical protein AB7H90_24010 [Alphaproteobacteria bacterium]